MAQTWILLFQLFSDWTTKIENLTMHCAGGLKAWTTAHRPKTIPTKCQKRADQPRLIPSASVAVLTHAARRDSIVTTVWMHNMQKPSVSGATRRPRLKVTATVPRNVTQRPQHRGVMSVATNLRQMSHACVTTVVQRDISNQKDTPNQKTTKFCLKKLTSFPQRGTPNTRTMATQDNLMETVFTHCTVCASPREDCDCEACPGCGQREFCCCSPRTPSYHCPCDHEKRHNDLACDCPCARCIGLRLDFQDRIAHGAIRQPFCVCDLYPHDDMVCDCACQECVDSRRNYQNIRSNPYWQETEDSMEDSMEDNMIYICQGCGANMGNDPGDWQGLFCSRSCAVEVMSS